MYENAAFCLPAPPTRRASKVAECFLQLQNLFFKLSKSLLQLQIAFFKLSKSILQLQIIFFK